MNFLMSAFHAPLAALLVASLAGCGPAPNGPADALPDDAPPAEAPPAEQTGAETARGLPADLAACAPPAAGSSWVETGRASDAGAVYVMLELAGSGASADFNPAIARQHGGACESYFMYETDSGPDTDIPPPGTDAINQMLDGSFAWHAEQSGGVEAYADVQRAASSGVLNECPPGEDLGPCLEPWLALRFRGAGVEVGFD